MLKSRVSIVVGILLATLCAAPVAMAQTVQDSTSVQRKVIYDPINYSQVRANLEWASKKTFWQRMVERFRAPLIKNNPDNKFIGELVGYMSNSEITNCYSLKYDSNQELTVINVAPEEIVIGIYGGKYNSSVNACERKSKK